jgi:hypothetical protein
MLELESKIRSGFYAVCGYDAWVKLFKIYQTRYFNPIVSEKINDCIENTDQQSN